MDLNEKAEAYGVDLEKIRNIAIEALNKRFDQEKEYFAIVAKINDISALIQLAADNLMSMQMSDQLKLLRIMVKQAEVSKNLCEKYGFIKEAEPEEESED